MHAESKPRSTFHSFVVTSEVGTKSYGVSVLLYEHLHETLQPSLETMCQEWRENGLSREDAEFYLHLRGLLRELRKQQESAGREARREHREKIQMYEALISKYNPAAFVDVAKEVWQPYAITLTSMFPLYSVMKDWLAKLVQAIETQTPLSVPLERHLVLLMHELPFPPAGKLQIEFRFEDLPLYISRPPLNSYPIIKDVSCIMPSG